MSHDGFEQLSAIAGLSREQDGISLTRVLINTLRAMSPGIEVSVTEVYGHRKLEPHAINGGHAGVSIRRFDETGQRIDQRETLEDLDGVLLRLQPTAVDAEHIGVGRLMVPVAGDIGPLRLVILDEVPIDPFLRIKLMQVVEIYGNLIKLMDSRERDALTGLLNRQSFAGLFELASQRHRANGHALALAVLDIDHFKKVNDTFGHLYGDEVLIHFARLMERSFRYTDDLFRFGGEEFVVLLANADATNAVVVLERFRKVVEGYAFPGVGTVTVSIGFVISDDNTLPTTLIDRADRALYFAKDSGRNRVVDFADMAQTDADASGVVQLF